MIPTIKAFEELWAYESGATRRVFLQLTDNSLGRDVEPQGRTLARLAWHIVQTIPEMAAHVGLTIPGPPHDTPPPQSAADIQRSYDMAAQELLRQVHETWTDDTLKIQDNLYGEMWSRATTLQALVLHQVHHRAQMTVLMRQAGLRVPGIYGPSREEWATMGMQPPKV